MNGLMTPILCPILQPVLRSVFDPRPGGAGTPTFDFYVDSFAAPGGDGTISSPFATLADVQAAALTHGDGVRIGLQRGSEWRESLDLRGLNNVTVQGIGDMALPLPKIDAAGVADNSDFTTTDDTDAVYQIVWTHDLTGSAPYTARWLRAWEDGKRLKWVASVELCDAEPGTFHCQAQGAVSNPTTFYVHPSNSSDPMTDGKLYEFSARDSSIYVDTGYDVRDLHTTRNSHKDGSFLSFGPGYAYSVLSTDGLIHNQWAAAGSTHEKCVVYDCEPSTWRSGTSATLFITHRDVGSPLTTRYKACAAYSHQVVSGHEALYAHTSGGANRLHRVEVDGMISYGSGSVSTGDTDALYVTNTFIEHPFARPPESQAAAANGGATFIDNITILNAARAFSGASSPTINDARLFTSADNSAGPFWSVGTAITNSTFAFLPELSDGQSMMFIYWSGGAASVFAGCAVEDAGLGALAAISNTSIESDGNVWWRSNAGINHFVVSPDEYNFAGWQAETGQDGNSAYLVNQPTRLFPNAHLGDFTAADGVVDADGRQSGSRKHIERPDWTALVARWQAGFIGLGEV